jgi:hypothetical protein
VKAVPSVPTYRVGSRPPPSDVEVSSEDDVPLQRTKRHFPSDRSAVGGLPLSG